MEIINRDLVLAKAAAAPARPEAERGETRRSLQGLLRKTKPIVRLFGLKMMIGLENKAKQTQSAATPAAPKWGRMHGVCSLLLSCPMWGSVLGFWLAVVGQRAIKTDWKE